MKRILVVEDDLVLNKTLCYNLTNSGYQITSAVSVREALSAVSISAVSVREALGEAPLSAVSVREALSAVSISAAAVNEDADQAASLSEPSESSAQSATREAASQAAKPFDLVILDVNLPDGNGFALCRRIKSADPAPAVIFLTARDMEEDMLSGFQMGADDYVTKPFPISVLQKKIEVLLGRGLRRPSADIYDDGTLHVNFSEMSAALAGKPIPFTATEYRILKLMIANAGVVLTRQLLLEKLWDVNENFVDEHALTSAISRIRSKIEKGGGQYIKTVYGMGYMWIGGIRK